ncbi:MAG: hypothetical protein AAF587_31775 [Bacteroidota bacterium]
MSTHTYIPQSLRLLGGVLLLAVTILPACTEFLSQSVEEVVLHINSPADSLYSQDHQLTFWWEADNRVESYRFQLVQPDFSNPIRIIDTTVIDTRLTFSLEEGRYLWRIRAENAASESTYQLQSMVVDTTAPRSPDLQFPSNESNLALDTDIPELRWNSQDSPIDGVRFPTQDSVILAISSTGQELGRFFRSKNEASSWNIQSLLPPQTEADSVHLRWKVVSFDLAGNRAESNWLSFQIIWP